MQFLSICSNTHFKYVGEEKTDEKVRGDTSPRLAKPGGSVPGSRAHADGPRVSADSLGLLIKASTAHQDAV